MPEGAEILTVQVQHEAPCIWAKVNLNAPAETRLIEIFGTGHPMSETERRYIGSYQSRGGALVFHVFEEVGEL